MVFITDCGCGGRLTNRLMRWIDAVVFGGAIRAIAIEVTIHPLHCIGAITVHSSGMCCFRWGLHSTKPSIFLEWPDTTLAEWQQSPPLLIQCGYVALPGAQTLSTCSFPLPPLNSSIMIHQPLSFLSSLCSDSDSISGFLTLPTHPPILCLLAGRQR